MGHFWVSGRFPIHKGPTPPLTPQTMLDACIQNFFPSSTLYGVGGGRTARKVRKGCTVLRGNRELTEKYEYCITEGLLSGIVPYYMKRYGHGAKNSKNVLVKKPNRSLFSRVIFRFPGFASLRLVIGWKKTSPFRFNQSQGTQNKLLRSCRRFPAPYASYI